MAIKEFKDYPNTETPLNATNINEMQTSLLNLVYPIGRGFIDFTDADYSNYLGFTWERELIGKTAVGLDTSDSDFDEVGKTGGSKFLQEHRHLMMTNRNASPSGVDRVAVIKGEYAFDLNTNYTGTGDSGNLQPFEVVSYWKRVA